MDDSYIDSLSYESDGSKISKDSEFETNADQNTNCTDDYGTDSSSEAVSSRTTKPKLITKVDTTPVKLRRNANGKFFVDGSSQKVSESLNDSFNTDEFDMVEISPQKKACLPVDKSRLKCLIGNSNSSKTKPKEVRRSWKFLEFVANYSTKSRGVTKLNSSRGTQTNGYSRIYQYSCVQHKDCHY
jgi:hypothetical protein